MAGPLDNIRIVLVSPKAPGNIGWSARGMKNMGLSRLYLVNPVEYQPEELKPFAFGAEDVLKEARVFSSLREALTEAQLAVATTRRTGKDRRPSYYLREAAARIVSAARTNVPAVVFGGEQSGLSNEEIALCDTIVTIPEESTYPSLNLSHAVTIVCYELYLASQSELLLPLLDLASREEVEGMLEHVRRALATMGYEKEGERDVLEIITSSLKRIFGRSGLERRDVNAIRGICRRIQTITALLHDERERNSSPEH
jgi:tRNA/rRNA methyltransferase